MSGTMQNKVLIALIVVVALFILYQYDNTLFGLLGRREGFTAVLGQQGTLAGGGREMTTGVAGGPAAGASPGGAVAQVTDANPNIAKNRQVAGASVPAGQELKKQPEGFADLASFEGPAGFASAEAPAGCYPRDQLTPSELLPLDQSSIYAQQNPMGPGSLKGKNFLSAGALIGVNTVGQSLRNANLQLRSEPPNPQVPVSVFMNSTISPDISHRPLELGS
jgi:hypothetical protein